MLSPTTHQVYARLVRRWLRFLDRRESDAALVVTFLESLTPALAKMARPALRQAGVSVPALRLRRHRRNDARLHRTVLSEADRSRLWSTPMSAKERALLTVLFVVRTAEAARLRWADVDLGGQLLYIQHGKGGKSAWTVLPGVAVTALAAWFETCGEPADDAWVFPCQDGHLASAKAIYLWVKRVFRRAGLDRPWRAGHALRRTMATAYLMEHRGDIRGLQVLLRHEDLATTAKYVFLNPEDLRPRLALVRL